MNAYVLSEPVHLTATFATLGGVLTDATIALTIRTPDGVETSVSASVVHESTGTYHYDYTTTMHGVHAYRWAASGALVAAYEGQFLVLPSDF